MFSELEERGAGDLLEELCPYFGTLWPSARVLAEWVHAKGAVEFQDRSVLELGCGLALPSFVASELGAHAFASDVHPDVPRFLEWNRELNPQCSVSYLCLDWRRAETALSGRTFDWILGSDILYERHQAVSLVSFLRVSLAPQGRAVFLDPDRSYWPVLVELGQRAGLRVEVSEPNCLPRGDAGRSVLIELTHGNQGEVQVSSG